MEVIATLENVTGSSVLRPGAFVEIIVPDRNFKDHFKIPETAVYGDDIVYVIEDGVLAARDVTVRARDGNYVILSANIEEGREILTTRIAEISEGLKVRKPDQASNGEN